MERNLQRDNPQRRKERVLVGCGAGFGGDRSSAALKLLQRVDKLDYLVLECLAERTLADRYQIMMSGGDGFDPRSMLRSFSFPLTHLLSFTHFYINQIVLVLCFFEASFISSVFYRRQLGHELLFLFLVFLTITRELEVRRMNHNSVHDVMCASTLVLS